jgi:hypothetical protein
VVPPSDARKPRRGDRAREGRTIAGVESLEGRQLLAYSPLGYSLPDLTIQAVSAPVASWGEPVAITATVFNTAVSTITEPFNQIPAGQTSPFSGTTGTAEGAPGTSHADAVASTIDIYASTRPGRGPYTQAGVLSVPSVPQNNLTVVSGDITLPARPAGFPEYGKIYFTYVVNPAGTVLEANPANNAYMSRQPVTLAPALPNLQVVGFYVPTPLVPGQTVTPVVQIANLGTAPTAQQGAITVQIVASQSKNYGPGDQVLASYVIDNIPALSAVTTTDSFGTPTDPYNELLNVQTPSNIATLSTVPVTLPSAPSTYLLGVKIDPTQALKQQGAHGSKTLDAYVKVGPPIAGLPATPSTPTGTTTAPGTYVFPEPIPGATVTSTTTSTTTTTTTTAAVASALATTTGQAVAYRLGRK